MAELQLKQQSRSEVLHTLNTFFQDPDKFHYSTWQGPDKLKTTNETALARFLLHTHSGHCEYFATATVLLLRHLGIPARYAVGYAVHEASGRKYVVRQRDAHAWCLVWNEDRNTWQDFDTTPASWVATEAGRASWMQFLSDCWSRIVFEIAKFRWGQTHLRQYLLWGVTPILALLLYQIIFRSGRRRHTGRPGETASLMPWPGLDSEFYRVAAKLAEHSAVRQPGESLSAWLPRACADPALSHLRSQLQGLLALHYRYRFDPEGLSQTDREALRSQAAGCLARLT
jgi:protein-glutamine gamma-glutamyltransferase